MAAPALDIPSFEGADVVIDGRLDEQVWQRAAVVTGFQRWRPAPGGEAPGRTEARIWSDEDQIYFGFICDDPEPGRVRAHVMPREDIDDDDQIGVHLDTFDDQRTAYAFWVNAAGVQQDFRDSVSSGPNFAWDTLWSSRAVRTETGYTVEIAIPWDSLWYPRAEVQTWGVVLQRKIPALDEYYAWPVLDRNKAGFYEQEAHLVGVRPPDTGLRLEIMPTLTARQTWSLDEASGEVRRDVEEGPLRGVAPGVDLRWNPTPDLALDASALPDFSQVESDPFLMDLNTRYALYLDEQRPIFLSGVDAYADPTETLYTRSITAPLAVLKLTGRQGRDSIGVLAALDTEPRASLVVERDTPGFSEEDVADRVASNAVARWRRDVGGSFQAGALLTQKSLLNDDGSLHSSNTVLGADAYGSFAERYSVTGQVRGSLTGPAGAPLSPGVAAFGTLNRKASQGWGGFVEGFYRSPDFRAEMAFQNRVGLMKVDTYQRYRFERSGSVWFQPGAEVALAMDDDPSTPPDTWAALDYDMQLGPAAYMNTGVGRGTESYLARHFETYWTWMTVDLEPAGWVALVFEGTLGQGVHYEDATQSYSGDGALRLSLRPLPPLQVEATYSHQTLWSKATGEVLASANLVRGEANYQFTRDLGLRALAQLRDDDAMLQLSSLLCWMPYPGRAVWLGYSEDRSTGVSASALDRAVFAKLSWLFRT